jgi:hypothetical protein
MKTGRISCAMITATGARWHHKYVLSLCYVTAVPINPHTPPTPQNLWPTGRCQFGHFSCRTPIDLDGETKIVSEQHGLNYRVPAQAKFYCTCPFLFSMSFYFFLYFILLQVFFVYLISSFYCFEGLCNCCFPLKCSKSLFILRTRRTPQVGVEFSTAPETEQS